MAIGQPESTREGIAHLEVGHTTVRPVTVRFLLAAFLLFIAAVPVFEFAVGGRDAASSALDHLIGIPPAMRADQPTGATLWRRVVLANRTALAGFHGFEEGLEDESRVGRMLRPQAQVLMARLGAGNELAYPGRDGWLFYRPDIEYLTSRGFLDRTTRKRRAAAVSEWDAPPGTDPAAAIRDFKQQLDARGIVLIVVPAPVKAAIHPERFSARLNAAAVPLRNPSYEVFIEELKRSGVLVFDPSEVIVETRRSTGADQYLATDTHWRPETVEIVAERLVEFLRSHVQLPPASAYYATRGSEVTNLGDIAAMLDLPANQQFYAPETVAIRQVIDADGAAWRSDRNADVLVLGDSFSNIYSLHSLGWGQSAGLVEHLSFVLQRRLDRIVQNDEGAFATRGMLHRAPERLNGKRVVIYQFVTRELAFGDWKIFGDGR